MNTTLRAIRAKSPCESGWKKLIRHLGGIDTYGLDTSLSVEIVLDSNGLDDAIWVLAYACGPEGERIFHLFSCDAAERVLPIFAAQRPNDNRPRTAVETKRRWIGGDATDNEWEAARAAAEEAAWAAAGAAAEEAAWAAAEEAAGEAAGAAAWAAVGEAAGAAAWAAVGEAEREWQVAHFRQMLRSQKP